MATAYVAPLILNRGLRFVLQYILKTYSKEKNFQRVLYINNLVYELRDTKIRPLCMKGCFPQC